MSRFFLIAAFLALAGCQSDEADMAQRRAAVDAEHDAKCQSFGAKKGTAEYVECRSTLYTQARQEDLQMRQAAAAVFANRQQPLQTYNMQTSQPVQPRPFNCTSIRNGVMVSTNCY